MNRELLIPADTPENLKWQNAENERASRTLHGLAAYEPFRQRLLALAKETKVSPLVRAGDLWFQREEQEFARILVRTSPTGTPRVLADVSAVAAESGAPARLEWFVPSPDGSLVAMSVEVAGDETSRVILLDVASGEQCPAEIPWLPAWPVAWLPDSSGFYIDSRNVQGGQFVGEGDSFYLYRLGRPAPEQAQQIPAALRFPRAHVSPDGRRTTLVMDSRTDFLREADGQWRPFLREIPGAHVGEFVGDDFVAVVTDGHPRGRVVRIPVATASNPATWREIVAESGDVLLHLAIVGDRIVLGLLRELSTVIEVRDLDGALLRQLDLPPNGTAGGQYATAGLLGEAPFIPSATEISFTFSTPTSSPAVYRYEVVEDRLTLLTPPAIEMKGCEVRQITAVSSDGTRVPATVVLPPGHAPGGPALPTVIEGYGNFGLALLPSFNSFAIPVLEAGGAYVTAHLRGGGEFGLEWWEQGRLGNKQRTFDDLFAIAEELISGGLTAPDKLAFHGASGGGLTAGAAIAQRPDLFRAVVARSPVLDLINRTGDSFQDSIASREFGSVLDPEQAAWMRAYSPAHHVLAGVEYPACLFVAGVNDPRCKPWQSRKMAALISAATSGERPILLRVHGNRGHAAIGAEAFAQETSEWLAFIADQIGLVPGSEIAPADLVGIGSEIPRAVLFRADALEALAGEAAMPGAPGAVRGSDLDQRNGSAASLGACPGRPHTRSSVGVPDRRPGAADQPFRRELNHEQLLAGDGLPRNLTTTYFENALERTDCGVWQCEPCDWHPMDMGARAEFFYVTEGAIVLREADGTVLEAPVGTAVYSPPGWSGQWRVPKRLTKVYISFFPPDGGRGR